MQSNIVKYHSQALVVNYPNFINLYHAVAYTLFFVNINFDVKPLFSPFPLIRLKMSSFGFFCRDK